MKQPQQHVLVVGRGVYALPVLRILAANKYPHHNKSSLFEKSNTKKEQQNDHDLHITFGSVGVGRPDMGSWSRFVDHVISLPRPDIVDNNQEAFGRAIANFARDKPQLIIVPVVEETIYVSLVADQIRRANPTVNILASSPDILMQLNDKFAFQKCMAEIHGNSKIPKTTLVKSYQEVMTCIQAYYLEDDDNNKAAPSVVVKPLVGHGGIGAHMVKRQDNDSIISSSAIQDFQRRYPLEFQKTSYVVQEFVEGQEISTFSLIQKGTVVAHVCYRPRYVSVHGFSPIRTLCSEKRWNRSLQYIQKVANELQLTGWFGFDFIERFQGELVALECNPRVTNGIAFFAPRVSMALATRMRQALLGPINNNSLSTTVLSPLNNANIPNHIMTFLPTLSCIIKAKTRCQSMQILELATQARDDVWWGEDPLPCVVMILRIIFNLLYAALLSLVSCSSKSITAIFEQFVLSEVVQFNRVAEPSLQATSLEAVGGLCHTFAPSDDDDNVHDNNHDGRFKVLVTGATGFLGGRVVQILNEGFQDEHNIISLPPMAQSCSIITATGRNVKKGQELMDSLKSTPGKKVQFVAVDLSDAEETARLVKGHDVVIHCAALCSILTWWDDLIDANVIAAENIVHACHLYAVKLLVHVSTPSLCVSIAPDAGDIVNLKETDPLPPDDCQPNRYSVTKKEAEAIVMDVSTRYQLSCIILRPRALFGPGDTTLFPILFDRLSRRKLRVIGNRRNSKGDFTYVDNVVYACLCCLDKRPTTTKIYSITNDDPKLFWDVIDLVCDKTGLQRVNRTKSIPWWIAYSAGWFLEAWANVKLLVVGVPSEPVTTRYGIGIVSKTTTFDISAAKQDLGYRPVVSFGDGIERFLDTLDNKVPEKDRQQ